MPFSKRRRAQSKMAVPLISTSLLGNKEALDLDPGTRRRIVPECLAKDVSRFLEFGHIRGIDGLGDPVFEGRALGGQTALDDLQDLGDLGADISDPDDLNIIKVAFEGSDTRQIERIAGSDALGEAVGPESLVRHIAHIRVAACDHSLPPLCV